MPERDVQSGHLSSPNEPPDLGLSWGSQAGEGRQIRARPSETLDLVFRGLALGSWGIQARLNVGQIECRPGLDFDL